MARCKTGSTKQAIALSKERSLQSEKIDCADLDFLSRVYNAVNNKNPQAIVGLLKSTDLIKLLMFSGKNEYERQELAKTQLNAGRANLSQNQHCPYILHALLLPLTQKPQSYFHNFTHEELIDLYKIVDNMNKQKLPQLNQDLLSKTNQNNPRIVLLKLVSGRWDAITKQLEIWSKALNEYATKGFTLEKDKQKEFFDKKAADELAPFEIAKLLKVNINAINQDTLRTMQPKLPQGAIVEHNTSRGLKFYLKTEFLPLFKEEFEKTYRKAKQHKSTHGKKTYVKASETLIEKASQVYEQPGNQNTSMVYEAIISDLKKHAQQLLEQENAIHAKRVDIENNIKTLQEKQKVVTAAQEEYARQKEQLDELLKSIRENQK